jgi:hypothetical protein
LRRGACFAEGGAFCANVDSIGCEDGDTLAVGSVPVIDTTVSLVFSLALPDPLARRRRLDSRSASAPSDNYTQKREANVQGHGNEKPDAHPVLLLSKRAGRALLATTKDPIRRLALQR